MNAELMSETPSPSMGQGWGGGKNPFSKLVLLVALAALQPSPSHAGQLDPYGVEDDIPPTPAHPITGSGCVFGALSNPLTLMDAVERSLCNHPKTREAWAAVKVRSEALGVASAAFLPTVSLSGQGLRDVSTTTVQGEPAMYSKSVASTYTEALQLSWVLFDFGGRSAAHDNAAEMLAAVEASRQAMLQQVFATVAKDYYAAQAAQGAYMAAVETERAARDSFDVAAKRVDKGASPISDQLQAQTAWFQARVNRAKAAGDWQNAVGALAADMVLKPDTVLALPDVEAGLKPDADFERSVSALIDDAVRDHPAVHAAEAAWRAAEAAVRQAEAEGQPSVSVVGKSTRNNQPVRESLGFPSHHASATDNYIGIELQVPLFDGLSNEYKVRQAKAQAEQQRYSVEEARQQAGLDVWTSYQTLQAATGNLTNDAQLLDTAQASYAVAQRRYASGIGAMIELLNAQSALAAAKRQKIQSLTDWRTSRLQLAAKLGTLGIDRVEAE